MKPSPVDSRALVASLNAAALARTLALHPGILIRTADLPSWRPCAPEYVGTLAGLEHLGTLVPLCTDGCVAWFLRRVAIEGEARNVSNTHFEPVALSAVEEYPETSLLHGHVRHFTWLRGGKGAPPQPYSESKLSSTPKAGKGPRGPSRASKLSLALELLNDAFGKEDK